MGTFAGLFQKAGAKIPDDKKEEFKSRIEKLFQAGGMMELERVQLCDRNVNVLKQASMHEYGMDFFYNYFEDAAWENAGFDIEGSSVWSEKIGWSEFHLVVVAAYVLESLYLNGPAIVMVNGKFVTAHRYVGWINYLFQEDYPKKNDDLWEVFETMHDQEDEYGMDLDMYDWDDLIYDIYGLIGYYEIRAVLSGSDAVDEEFDKMMNSKEKRKGDDKKTFFDYSRAFKATVIDYRKKSSWDKTEQLSRIMEMLRLYFEQENMSLEICKKYEDKDLEIICLLAALTDAPAYLVKVVSEIYEKDFWELWKEMEGASPKRIYQKVSQKTIMSVSTKDFFRITADDMILFWGEDKNIQFSHEIKEWFVDLRKQFEDILREEFMPQNPLLWILDLMKYADENYYRVYTFSDYFEETILYLSDKRFLALWKIYEKMLHDHEMEEAGNLIFVPDGPEYEKIGIHYWGTQPRRRLKTQWDMMKKEEKNNKARVTFRRYMALVANRKLRKEVFGF